jgi:SpoVK/Ycf46/Vps4 family AAA+-type ATPase
MSSTPEIPKGKQVKVISVDKLTPGTEFRLSDWQIAASNADGTITMANMEITHSDAIDEGAYEIRPGSWRVTPRTGLQKVEFLNSVYYPTETSERLNKIFNTFRNNLHVYDELGLKAKKRGVLLGSIPGVGKSSLINNFCSSLLGHSRACILYVDNENVDFETVQKMFRKAEITAADFIVLVIEDIGGSDLSDRNHHIDSTLLNFLDGQEGMFRIPTLVIGTTNYLDLLKDSITSRPGRFDIVMEVLPPGEAESILFVENFMKRPLADNEKAALKGKNYTPAYLRECVIRHRLDEISFIEAENFIYEQRKLSENKQHKNPGRRSMGFIED